MKKCAPLNVDKNKYQSDLDRWKMCRRDADLKACQGVMPWWYFTNSSLMMIFQWKKLTVTMCLPMRPFYAYLGVKAELQQKNKIQQFLILLYFFKYYLYLQYFRFSSTLRVFLICIKIFSALSGICAWRLARKFQAENRLLKV